MISRPLCLLDLRQGRARPWMVEPSRRVSRGHDYEEHAGCQVTRTPSPSAASPDMVPPLWLTEARGLRADLIALAAGALAALALPPLHVLPILLVAFPILLAQVNLAGRPIVAARRGWWFGFGYHLFGLYWITEAILFEAARFWWLVPLAVPAVAAVLAVFIALPAWLRGTWFATGHPDWIGLDRANHLRTQVLLLAGGWVLGDLARQFVATGFPWNPLGSVWAAPGWVGDVLIQPAALISVHGLTLMTVGLACAPDAALARPGHVSRAIFLAWIGFGLCRMATAAAAGPNRARRTGAGQCAAGAEMGSGSARRRVRALPPAHRRRGFAGGRQRSAAWWFGRRPRAHISLDGPARDAILAASHGGPVLAGAVRFDEADRPRNTLFAITARRARSMACTTNGTWFRSASTSRVGPKLAFNWCRVAASRPGQAREPCAFPGCRRLGR